MWKAKQTMTMNPTMQMKPIIKKIAMMGLMLLMPCLGFSQSASESYNKGVALMNKAEYTEAIRCFKASMAINKSAANVKKCNEQISKCQRLQKGTVASVSPKPAREALRLNVNRVFMTFPADQEQTIAAKVEVSPEKSGWTASLATDVNWCRLTKSMDGNELYVTCIPSNSVNKRTVKVNVVLGSLTQTIDVVQQGIGDVAYKGVYHIVAKGERLQDIAKRYGVTIKNLTEWNGLTTMTIAPGMKLKVSAP